MDGSSPTEPVEARHLAVLVALAEEGTFTDAAIRLGTGQPTVSRTLARFEALLGVQLVQRTTRSLRLTEAGAACYPAALEALAALERVAAAARGHDRPLRLGYAWAAFGSHTSAVLRCWREQHPEVQLDVHRVDERSAGLLDGTVDVAVRRGPVEEPGVHVEPIFSEGRMAVVPVGHRLAGRASVHLADLAEETVALAAGIGTTTLDLWPADARPSRAVQVTNTDEWLLAVASGEAVGVTPASTAAQHSHPGVMFVPLLEVPSITVSLVWPEEAAHPAIPRLVALVRDIVGEGGPA